MREVPKWVWAVLVLAAAAVLAAGMITPPGPGPNPQPPLPPDGQLRVILAYESTQAMTKEQLAVLYSPKVADWLDKGCGKEGWRRWDKDVDVSHEPAPWPELWRAAKPQLARLPAVVIFRGSQGVAVPLPETVEGMLALLEKYK